MVSSVLCYLFQINLKKTKKLRTAHFRKLIIQQNKFNIWHINFTYDYGLHKMKLTLTGEDARPNPQLWVK